MIDAHLHITAALGGYTEGECLELQAVSNALFFGKAPAAEGTATLIQTGGYPGAGKSRFSYALEQQHPDYVRVDVNDNCLLRIPSYEKSYMKDGPEEAYRKWRTGSIWIAQQAARRAVEENYNLILVGTGTDPRAALLIADAKANGYTVEFNALAAGLEICRERSKPENRMSYLEDTGGVSFWLPENHISEKRPLFDKAAGNLMQAANRAFMYWNPSNDHEPVLAFRSRTTLTGGHHQLDITDEAATREILEAAGQTPEQPLKQALTRHLGWDK